MNGPRILRWFLISLLGLGLAVGVPEIGIDWQALLLALAYFLFGTAGALAAFAGVALIFAAFSSAEWWQIVLPSLLVLLSFGATVDRWFSGRFFKFYALLLSLSFFDGAFWRFFFLREGAPRGAWELRDGIGFALLLVVGMLSSWWLRPESPPRRSYG